MCPIVDTLLDSFSDLPCKAAYTYNCVCRQLFFYVFCNSLVACVSVMFCGMVLFGICVYTYS